MHTRLIDGVNKKGEGIEIQIQNSKGKEILKTDVVLVSIGRKPYTSGLQLEKAGLSTNKFGRIEINKFWQTKIPNIYGIGDVVHGPMLAHKAEEEGIAVVEHICGEGGHVNYESIPGVIYTDPEVANVGLSEQ